MFQSGWHGFPYLIGTLNPNPVFKTQPSMEKSTVALCVFCIFLLVAVSSCKKSSTADRDQIENTIAYSNGMEV